MNYIDLVRKTAHEAHMTQENTRTVLDALLQVTEDALAAGDSITVTGYGIMSVEERPSKVINTPLTHGTDVTIPARKAIKFKAAPRLKARLNAGSK